MGTGIGMFVVIREISGSGRTDNQSKCQECQVEVTRSLEGCSVNTAVRGAYEDLGRQGSTVVIVDW